MLGVEKMGLKSGKAPARSGLTAAAFGNRLKINLFVFDCFFLPCVENMSGEERGGDKPEPVCAVWEWWGLLAGGGGEHVLAFGEALCEHTLAQ